MPRLRELLVSYATHSISHNRERYYVPFPSYDSITLYMMRAWDVANDEGIVSAPVSDKLLNQPDYNKCGYSLAFWT